MISHILVVIDGSAHAIAALDIACELATRFEARLTLMHVMRDSELALLPKEIRDLVPGERSGRRGEGLPNEAFVEVLKRAEERARGAGVREVTTRLESGDPASRIVGFAKENDVGLIVMGRRGLSDLQGLLIGSVSHKILHLADCPCLTVR
jgi:nucleotide-binding universal stress UspA family protein